MSINDKTQLSLIVSNDAIPKGAGSIPPKGTPLHLAAPDEAAQLEKMNEAMEKYPGLHSLAMKLNGNLLLQRIVKSALEHANSIPVDDANETGNEPPVAISFRVIVGDNFHYMDSSEEYTEGTYETAEQAIEVSKRMVDEFLASAFEPGLSAAALWDHYTSFGEDPAVVPSEGPRVPFSAWDYAKERCETLCSR